VTYPLTLKKAFMEKNTNGRVVRAFHLKDKNEEGCYNKEQKTKGGNKMNNYFYAKKN
jgi:hypothetical protein